MLASVMRNSQSVRLVWSTLISCSITVSTLYFQVILSAEAMCAEMIRLRMRPPYEPPLKCKYCVGNIPKFWKFSSLHAHLRGIHKYPNFILVNLAEYETYSGSVRDMLPEDFRVPLETISPRQMSVSSSLEMAVFAGKSMFECVSI